MLYKVTKITKTRTIFYVEADNFESAEEEVALGWHEPFEEEEVAEEFNAEEDE